MKPRNKRIQEKHYGLFHGPLRIEVEIVTARHKKPCDGCGEPPEGRRLKVTAGGGRAQVISVYCSSCGVEWLLDHEEEAGRARVRLAEGSNICVRLRESDAD